MNLYQLRPDPDLFNGLLLEDQDWNLPLRLKGQRMADSWRPLPVKSQLAHDGRRARNQEGDYPSLGGIIPVLNRRSLDVLRPLIESAVEILPLAHPTLELYAIHVLDVLDCVDYDRAEYTRYSDGDRGVNQILRYAFRPGTLDNRHIFKIKQFEVSFPFVSEEFKRRVEDNGLLGFEFWPIDDEGRLQQPPERARQQKRKR